LKIRGEVNFLSAAEATFDKAIIRGEEKKMFTSSSNICPEACCGKGWVVGGIKPPTLTTNPFPG
jgi:hypothetical protein